MENETPGTETTKGEPEKKSITRLVKIDSLIEKIGSEVERKYEGWRNPIKTFHTGRNCASHGADQNVERAQDDDGEDDIMRDPNDSAWTGADDDDDEELGSDWAPGAGIDGLTIQRGEVTANYKLWSIKNKVVYAKTFM